MSESSPGLHVFIVGISHYSHLPDDPPNEDHPPEAPADADGYGMKRLKTPTRSAFEVLRFLCHPPPDPGLELALPLASCRLILSPSEVEAQALELDPLYQQVLSGQPAPSNGETIDVQLFEPSVGGFRDAAAAWRADSESDEKNISFFYFSGHGSEYRGDRALLMPDFNRQNEPLYTQAISSQLLIDGMYGSRHSVKMAATQYYFFDCCGNYIYKGAFDREIKDPQPPFVDGVKMPTDNRLIAKFYAAAPGGTAKGIDGQTLFSRAVLLALQRGASARTNWGVTATPMSLVLDSEVHKLNQEYGYSQQYRPHLIGMGFRPLFTRKTPVTDADFWVLLDQREDAANAELHLQAVDGSHQSSHGPPLPVRQFCGRIPGTDYEIQCDSHEADWFVEPTRKVVTPPADNTSLSPTPQLAEAN